MSDAATTPTSGHTAPCTIGTLHPLAATVAYTLDDDGQPLVDYVQVGDARIEYLWLSDQATDELERQIRRHRRQEGGAA